MGIVLGPMSRPEPLYIGHRYLGLERDYSATLNNPKSLLLNQNPYAIAVDKFETIPEGQTTRYEGLSTPVDMGWDLIGFDQGELDLGQGTYTVVSQNDPNTGSLDDAFATTYSQPIDLSFEAGVTTAARFTVDLDQTTPSGVFTGVGFGVHNNRRLYLMGCLVIEPKGQNADTEE